MAALKFHIVKKYTTNQNQKGTGYAFKDFVFDCVQKMAETQEREDEKASTDDYALPSISTAQTPLSCKRLPVKDSVDHLQVGLRKHKMVHVPASEKKEICGIKKVHSLFSTQRKKGNQLYVFGLRCGTCFGEYYVKENC
jgi:hypothetical protein